MLPSDDLQILFDLLRRLCLRTAGDLPKQLTVKLQGGSKIVLPVPSISIALPVPENESRAAGSAAPASSWASGPAIKCRSDGQQLYHPLFGLFTFNGSDQRQAIRLLFEAAEEGTWDVSQEELLRTVGSASPKIHDLFKAHRQKPLVGEGRLIQSSGAGMYRLAPLTSEDGGLR